MKSLQGHLLVATTDLADPNFARSVVLLVQHTEEGALGLILNRPTNVTIKQAWEKIRETPCVCEEVLRFGGPCEGPLMAIHTRDALSDNEVLPGVFFDGNPEALEELVCDDDGQVRFYVGCAGWGEGQLERELNENSWLTAPASIEQIFSPDDSLWIQLTREITGNRLVEALKIKHKPQDLSVN